jgi:tetratricopeptide (TPR) repeat protein
MLFLSFHLFSAEIQEKKGDYKLALEYYKTKDFKNSYTLFKKIYMDELSNINFNFYFGKSAYETGHYETALAAFERVEMQGDSNIGNKLEIARTYFMLKMYADAENAYLAILENPLIPKNLRRDIELSLSRVSKVQKRSFTYATIVADVLYDSNLNYGSLGDYTLNGIFTPKTAKISDTAVQIFANAINIYDIGSKNGFAIKNSVSVYQKSYQDNQNFNVTYLAYNPSVIYKVTKYTAELVLGIGNIRFGGDNYLNSYSINPKFEWNHHSHTLKSIFNFKYQRKNFVQEGQKELDANHFELSYGVQKIITPHSYTQGNIYAINEQHIRGTNPQVDFNEYKFDFTYANQFSNKFSIDTYGQIRKRNYDNYSLLSRSTRSDLGGTASIGLTMKIIPKLRTRISTSYEKVDSNQDQFSYKKQIISASLIKTF